ncbi:unnamed protein product [Pedinophyceae sp. YPF-701]|nr:unnamed protein product [Pedinophyceae sp. YPF-701]
MWRFVIASLVAGAVALAAAAASGRASLIGTLPAAAMLRGVLPQKLLDAADQYIQSLSRPPGDLPEDSDAPTLMEGSIHAAGPEQAEGACGLKGEVHEHCGCTYEEVDRLNRAVIHPILAELTSTPFFRYFKVNLVCDCPFWPEDGMCSAPDCSVCTCPEDEVPKPWRTPALGTQDPSCEAATSGHGDAEGQVDLGLGGVGPLQGTTFGGSDNPWLAPRDMYGREEDYEYVDLLVNPERYTGYKGAHSHRIWRALYSQSCFSGITEEGLFGDEGGGTCSVQAVFFKLLSGMHASITSHIAANHLLERRTARNGTTEDVWGPNTDVFLDRLARPGRRHRIENLYFTFLVVLRAVTKAAPALLGHDYTVGDPAVDARTRELVASLVGNQELQASCPLPFDEGALWTSGDAWAAAGDGGDGERVEVFQQLQGSFRNMTLVMNCVGCEKCKLWGKLQILGMASALKVVMAEASVAAGQAPMDVALERNEVIALVNFLARLSTSLETARKMGQLALALDGQGAGAWDQVPDTSSADDEGPELPRTGGVPGWNDLF